MPSTGQNWLSLSRYYEQWSLLHLINPEPYSTLWPSSQCYLQYWTYLSKMCLRFSFPHSGDTLVLCPGILQTVYFPPIKTALYLFICSKKVTHLVSNLVVTWVLLGVRWGWEREQRREWAEQQLHKLMRAGKICSFPFNAWLLNTQQVWFPDSKFLLLRRTQTVALVPKLHKFRVRVQNSLEF